MTIQLDTRDTTERMSWGWIAMIHGLSEGPWMNPTVASRLVGVPSSTLRRWAERGVITRLRPSGSKHCRYFGPELVHVLQITANAPTLRALNRYIEQKMGG